MREPFQNLNSNNEIYMFFLRLLKNKYLLTVIALIVWLLFFDKNDVFTQYELIEKCRKLQKEKEYYLAEIESNRAGLTELRNNPKSLERFSREKYLMKKDNEDVFVLVAR
jgi:cell division protein FtsB